MDMAMHIWIVILLPACHFGDIIQFNLQETYSMFKTREKPKFRSTIIAILTAGMSIFLLSNWQPVNRWLSQTAVMNENQKPFQDHGMFAGIENFQVLAAVHKNRKLMHNADNITPIINARTPYPLNEADFYDHPADPDERNDIAGIHCTPAKGSIDDTVAFLRDFVLQWEGEDREGRIETNETQKNEALEALKAPGYIK